MSQPGDRGPRASRPGRDEDSTREAAAKVTVEGTIQEALPNAIYAVTLDNGQRILSHITGLMQTRTVRVVPGDRVTVELSPYDRSRGRITRLHR